MAEVKPEIVGEIVLTDFRKIVLSIGEYKGEERLDIREMADANKDPVDHTWVFTKRGVQIPVHKYKRFIKLVKRFKDRVQV